MPAGYTILFGPSPSPFQGSAHCAPGQLCNNLLHKPPVGIRLGKSPHIFEVSSPQPGHSGKGVAQVMGKPVYHLCSPSFRLLASENVFPDAPIEQHKFPIDRQGRAHLRAADALFQFLEERVIPVRQFRMISLHERKPA